MILNALSKASQEVKNHEHDLENQRRSHNHRGSQNLEIVNEETPMLSNSNTVNQNRRSSLVQNKWRKSIRNVINKNRERTDSEVLAWVAQNDTPDFDEFHVITWKECLLIFFTYLFVGVLGFSFLFEHWCVRDSLYFR